MKQYKSSDEKRLLALMKDLGVPMKRYDQPIFLNATALKQGATHSYCIRDEVDFYFNAKGKLIGTTTNYSDSFLRRSE